MNNYDLILEDLQQILPTYITVLPPFYNPADSPEVKVKALNRQLRRSKSNNNRVELLVNLFYLEELLEIHLDPNERSKGVKLITRYYLFLSIRVYYLFEVLGVEQIYRSRNLITIMLKSLSKPQVLRLSQKAITITGAQLEEEEVVNI